MKISKAGMLDSIQDMGRFGYQQFGINPTGAMDKYAAAIVNILVGNDPNDPVIEMHFPASTIEFHEPALIALSGADFDATIDGDPVPLNHPVLINENRTLSFRSLKKGTRCYLAISGGINVNTWLSSYSTNLKAEAGGFEGRRLLKDDLIELNNTKDYHFSADKNFRILPWKANKDSGIEAGGEFLILKSSEWDWLDQTSQEKFLKNPFFISHNSDRMGYRLASEPLYASIKAELISSAVGFGTIQLLPDGQLIILMADHQTTGGYPRLGNVISVHLPVLAQMNAGEEIRFKFTDHITAEGLLIKQQQHLLQLENACKLKLDNLNYENY